MAQAQLSVREARASDVADIQDFFRQIRRRFLTFGAEDLPHILRDGYVFIAQTGHLLWGTLVLSPRGNGLAQVRGLGLIDGWQAITGVRLLMQAARPSLHSAGIHTLYCVLTEAWLHGPLEAAGFQVVDRIITFMRHTHNIPAVPNGPARVRLLQPHEIGIIAKLDADTFPPQWHFSRRELAHMLTTGCRITVALVGETVVGYACVEVRGEFGHIVRLAVHPLWQERGIGRQMLLEAMHYLRDAGATRLTLNTQQSNRRAQPLYEHLGFRRFGRVIPVLEHELAEAQETQEQA